MAFAVAALSLLLASAPAQAKEAIAHFPTDRGDVAVNSTGAGPADAGDIYVLGGFAAHRITRFATDDNGTPANPYDDTYEFVSMWGADVDATPSGGSDYEVCAVQADCKAGVASGGNGTTAGNGTLDTPEGIAVDQDTGNVYVTDTKNNRISVYSGDGAFLRSFGWDVVESGPGETPADEHEVCVAAAADVCKAGLSGGGVGQLTGSAGFGYGIAVSAPDGNSTSGTVFVADTANRRVNAYGLDGSSPSFFGSAAEFSGSLAPAHVAVDARGIVYATDIANGSEVDRYDSQDANGGGVGFLASIPAPPLSTANTSPEGLEVDPDSDGPGPDTDVLYVLRDASSPNDTAVQQFGPVNAPGLIAPPAAHDAQHGLAIGFEFINGGFGLDIASGRLFVATQHNPTHGTGLGTYVLDEAGSAPAATLDSVTDVTQRSATVNATVDPNGAPPVSYRLEYSLNGTDWTVDPSAETVLGIQDDPQQVSAVLEPPAIGLVPGTEYHVRLAVTKAFTAQVITAAETFTTLSAPPEAETTGAPVRTSTTARLTGRVNPNGLATDYWFEYGAQGPCDANPCSSTPARSAGSGKLIEPLAEDVSGLAPGTAYHFRLLAENGVGDPVAGEDTTVTTRATDAPLSHGDFPGPPGSDRAYEQVSPPDVSGSQIAAGFAFSDSGDRALYQILGGTPDSITGSTFNVGFAERPAGAHPTSGWATASLAVPRGELAGKNWFSPAVSDDLSTVVVLNSDGDASKFFRFSPGLAPLPLLSESDWLAPTHTVSGDGSRVLTESIVALDPVHPAPPVPGVPGQTLRQVYDITDGSAELVSLLPDGSVPSCDASLPIAAAAASAPPASHEARAISYDGSLLFFKVPCAGGLHVRDLAAETTTFIGGSFIKAMPGAFFFTTAASLDPEDGGGSDVYRYDLGAGEADCVTCVVEGFDVDIIAQDVAAASDGSRVYFRSPHVLLPGAAAKGIYRVEVATGDLAYVASPGESNGLGESEHATQAISHDGSVIAFRSSSPALNPLGDGADNGATRQYYLYDDRDRSLTCVSCPQDGSPPVGPVREGSVVSGGVVGGANVDPMADDGTFVFGTPTPLLGADQNTAGPAGVAESGNDVYEWRDGRPLLISDGLTRWDTLETGLGVQANIAPAGISPSGRDVFFIAGAQLTPDALDSFRRLYTARIGGGIDFPEAEPPCPLEVCQGIPKGAPEEALPGTSAFRGPGNTARSSERKARCAKGKRRVRRNGKARCVKPRQGKRSQRKHRANNKRRASR